jgi:hypothetical protein
VPRAKLIKPKSDPSAIGAILLSLVVWPGCTADPVPTVPSEPAIEESQTLEAARSNQSAKTGLAKGSIVQLDLDLYEDVTSTTVRPGEVTEVQGSRYSLTFKELSVNKNTVVTISERHPYIVDVVLGPDGIQFGESVVLEIDYTDTANDPSTPYFHGKEPVVYWWDDKNEEWVPMEGAYDPVTLTFTVLLEHFSRYAMHDGTGGWEGPNGRNTTLREADKVSAQ